jgi:O-Antigen ligase
MSRALVDPVPDSAPGREAGEHLTRSAVWRDRIAAIGLGALGAALGVSQTVHGAYNETTWAPIALGALGLALALAIAAPRPPPLALLAPVLGLWLWSLVSTGWSDSTDAAHAAANRWLLYAAAIALLSWGLAGDRRRATVLLTCASAGVLGVAAWILARMVAGHGPSLFLGARLNDPLGYVNGQAGYLLAAAWPCLALVERRGSRPAAPIAGIGMAGLVTLLGLGLLCQSRSWEVALVGAVVVLEVAVPGRRRRAAALLLAGATIAAIYAPLAHVWRHPSHATGLVTVGATRHAAVAIVAGALAAGVAWMFVVLAVHRLAPAGSRARARLRQLASAALAALGLAAAVAIGSGAGAIGNRIHSQYEAFVHLSSAPGGTRLFSGAGDRYDYWRVALVEFRSAPVGGVGAGNYQPGYYRHRKTTEAITQPHSLELQTLAELGLVGGLLLAAFLGAVAIGLGRTARAARHDLLARGTAVAAGGTFTVWLVQTSVDWMHLIPGLTAMALGAAVALVARPSAATGALAGRARVATIAAAAAIAIAGAVTIVPRVLSLHAQTSAQRALARGAPRTAIIDATTALKYDPSSVPALVMRAAGFARLHAFAPSLADLKRARALEPHNWTTWALVGDLLMRHGDRSAARAAYARALALDPLEPDLRSALATSAPRSGR